ncbi:hypothetical protein MTO96_004328 [Rhipicephalus appendiculatus]
MKVSYTYETAAHRAVLDVKIGGRRVTMIHTAYKRTAACKRRCNNVIMVGGPRPEQRASLRGQELQGNAAS